MVRGFKLNECNKCMVRTSNFMVAIAYSSRVRVVGGGDVRTEVRYPSCGMDMDEF